MPLATLKEVLGIATQSKTAIPILTILKYRKPLSLQQKSITAP